MNSRPAGGSAGFLPDPRLGQGFALLQAGRTSEAGAFFSTQLNAKAKIAAQAHFGLALAQRADPPRYERHLSEALKLDPALAPAAQALADLQRQSGRPELAIETLARLARQSRDPLLHFNLGALRMERRAVNAALEDFRNAARLRPDMAEAWQGLAQAHRMLGEFKDASEALRRLVGLRPGQPGPLKSLVQTLVQLGRADAVPDARQLAELRPDDPGAFDLLASALTLAGQHAEALAAIDRAAALQPDDPALLLRRADVLRGLGRTEDAAAICRRMAADQADRSMRGAAHERLGMWALADGETEAARRHLEAVLREMPDHAGARMRLGALLLSEGVFDPGWRLYDARFEAGLEAGGILAQPFPQPRWRGESLDGRAILVWSEQGVGDDILLASMIPDLARAAGRVLLVCEPRLVPVFRRSLPGNVAIYARSAPPHPDLLDRAIDFQIPMGSVGEFLRRDWAAFGAGAPFLAADPDKRARFAKRYAALPGLKVGLSWRSSNLVNGAHKACPLEEWGPILQVPGVSFVNLQYGNCAAELKRIRELYGVAVHHDPSVDQLKDMDGFMAQVASLDLVVGISNAASHAAGALGVPTLVLLSAAPLWVWFRDRTDSPWYSSARLFRQRRFGAWTEPVAEVGHALENAARPT